MDNYPDDWLIEWPDTDGPIPVVCSSCHILHDERDMRRPLTAAERALGRHGWVSTLVCKTCRAAKERELAPAALARHLAKQGTVPPTVIDMRVAAACARSTKERSLSARKKWAEKYAAGTREMLKEMDREKGQFRSRAYYLRNRCDDPERAGAGPALDAYADFLAHVMTTVRVRSKQGKAPRVPWWENLYITRECCTMLPPIVEQLAEAGREYPKALAAGFPSWWEDRDRLLTFRDPPKEPVDEEPIDPTDFEALVAKARAPWAKRNTGTPLPRKPRTRPFAPPIEIPGVDPVFTADDPPPTRRPREPVLSAKERLALMMEDRPRVAAPNDLVIPRTPRTAAEPITDAQYAEIEAQIRADNESMLDSWAKQRELRNKKEESHEPRRSRDDNDL